MTKKNLLSFKSGHIYMKDTQCDETNEKLILRFLRFIAYEMVTQNLTRLLKKYFIPKGAESSDLDELIHLFNLRRLRPPKLPGSWEASPTTPPAGDSAPRPRLLLD